MQDAEKAMFPYVAINPTDGYYSPTQDNKYPAWPARLSDKLNDIVVGRQPFSDLDQVAKAGSTTAEPDAHRVRKGDRRRQVLAARRPLGAPGGAQPTALRPGDARPTGDARPVW